MKTAKILMAVAIVLCGMGLASQASALSFGDANYIGIVVDGIPSSEAAEAGYINNLITLAAGAGDTVIGTETYNRVGSTIDCVALPCPPATATGAQKEDSNDTTIDVTGFTYLLAKYDAGQAGSLVWYVGNLTGIQDVPASFGTCGSRGCGLSHTTLFNPTTTSVPEPGTLVLLGSALVGLGILRRRR